MSFYDNASKHILPITSHKLWVLSHTVCSHHFFHKNSVIKTTYNQHTCFLYWRKQLIILNHHDCFFLGFAKWKISLSSFRCRNKKNAKQISFFLHTFFNSLISQFLIFLVKIIEYSCGTWTFWFQILNAVWKNYTNKFLYEHLSIYQPMDSSQTIVTFK